MSLEICKLEELNNYTIVIIIAKYKNQWLLCKHKNRDTWETAGGHIELNETPNEAAKRELYEETGASSYEIKPVFDCLIKDKGEKVNCMVFFAEIYEIEVLPSYEIKEVRRFKILPNNLTYKNITTDLFNHYIAIKRINK